MTTIARIEVRRLSLPLTTPYRLSYRTFTEFEPYVVIATDESGRSAFGEGHISPGSSSETRDGGWAFLAENAKALPGRDCAEAMELLASATGESPVAATALISALEMLARHELLAVAEPLTLPLLSPVNATDRDALEPELEGRLAEGFTCFKVKVGKDVEHDIERLGWIQDIVGERATLRTDANRAYDVEAAMRFATGINPDGVELFEQPCHADDWEGNAAVARVARVPLMLDEPICTEADIDRAAAIDGVGYCKVKLKRFGGMTRLASAIQRIRDRGMGAVLGDGLGAEAACWMEACVARTLIDNAGEFNGYLKPSVRLFAEPLGFENGALVTPRDYRPTLDVAAVDRLTIEAMAFEK